MNFTPRMIKIFSPAKFGSRYVNESELDLLIENGFVEKRNEDFWFLSSDEVFITDIFNYLCKNK